MRQRDRIRHILRRLVGGVAEHHALIAGAGVEVVRKFARLSLQRFVHAEGDVVRLLVESDKDGNLIAVESFFAVVVTDLVDRLANDCRNV